ncbi:MAG TPA: type II toxin-antitoxin system HicB family antitoxin [Candidatus Acidoferrales bacterium]|nr:type II toxin-antitoxin system HicB family antitoxin [Candidatus Acidoferrales bacterium]
MGQNYKTVVVKQGGQYVASLYELPGVWAQGKTPAEARRLLKEAVAKTKQSDQEYASRLRARLARRKGE